MTPSQTRLLLALAAVLPAYACFINGWQVVSFGSLTVRAGDGMPDGLWMPTAISALRMILLALLLYFVWLFAGRTDWRRAIRALAVAYVIAVTNVLALFSL